MSNLDINLVLVGVIFFLIVVALLFIRETSKVNEKVWLSSVYKLILLASFAAVTFATGGVLMVGRAKALDYIGAGWPELKNPFYERQFDNGCDTRTDMILKFLAGEQGVWGLIKENMDLYLCAHTVGWVGACIVLGDNWLCWWISIIHEILEKSFSRVYPPFSECWWDSYILDFGGNTIACLIIAPIIFKLTGMERRSFWSSYPGRLMYVFVAVSQVPLFPMSFWYAHVLGIPPKHALGAFSIYFHQYVSNMLMTNVVWHQSRPRASKGDSTPWTYLFTIIMVIQVATVITFNAEIPEGRQLILDGWAFNVWIGSVVNFALAISCFIPRLRGIADGVQSAKDKEAKLS